MIGFLHTADVHTATFTRLVGELAPGMPSTHVVDSSLLADARSRDGVDDELRARIVERLREAAGSADVVVCTCSTISGAAEAVTDAVGTPVVRIDRPMAEQAVATGPRIAVVAALASTLQPTTELLEQVATAQSRSVELTEIVCADAWPMLERGNLDDYYDSIAANVDSIVTPVDVIVLAQASMAAAIPRCHTTIPVLSSPRLAVEAALAQLRA